MKKTIFAMAILMLGSLMTASAQIVVNKDSLSLVARLTKDRETLLKLQSQLETRTKEKNDAAEKAQGSADDNRRAANKLSNDPQDRKLARKADNAASDARRDAKRARQAADKLDQLNKDIRDLSDDIEKNEKKLNTYTRLSTDATPANP